MNEWQKARICWIPAAAGGRNQPPTGPRYSTIARFDDEEKPTDWSIIVEFDQQADKEGCIEGQIRFLAPEAPSHLLQPGSRCKLVEGRRIVATVEILLTARSPIPVNGVYQPKSVKVLPDLSRP
jgi:hypothetical protein